jgi:hypothetical protein
MKSFTNKYAEWRVKVRDNQFSMRVIKLTGLITRFFKNWGRKSRVAPEGSALSPQWLNINEG